jgi:3-methyladenine DNA glycosylase AlkD
MTWSDDVVLATREALIPLADVERAAQMQAYMKNVSPFLGITATARRGAQRETWSTFGPPPDQGELARAAPALFACNEREFAYAACDLLARHVGRLDAGFLVDPVEGLLATRPWWDTVDGLGTAVVSPLCHRYPELRDVIDRWSRSDDRWLVRAAIQHQRGWRADTDVDYVLVLCDAHAKERDFFIQKAIGWALRDLAGLDATAVSTFVRRHPQLTRVATREAERGLAVTLACAVDGSAWAAANALPDRHRRPKVRVP